MIFNTSLFLKLLTPEFLFFSWNDLKKNKELYYGFSYVTTVKPISKLWFSKVSYLIQKGRFVYKNKKNLFLLKSSKKTVEGLKIQILENAFFLVMQPYFLGNYSIKNFTLTECVRFFY